VFRSGWPCKYSGPDFNAKANEIAMESVEICHEGLVLSD
jgi:phage tail-like protein